MPSDRKTRALARPMLVLAGFGGVIFTLYLVANCGADTTAVSNGAFTLLTTLTLLTFTFGRAADIQPDIRDKFLASAERFFLATILLFMSSVTKYSLIAIKRLAPGQASSWLGAGVDVFFGLAAALCFFCAMVVAYAGLRTVLSQLLARGGKPWEPL